MGIPEAVSIRKFAEVLDISTMTVHRWIRDGVIKAYRVGPKLVRIPRSEIVRMRALRIVPPDERSSYPKV